MCGRYYIDEDTAIELGKIVEELDRKHQIGKIKAGDVFPSNEAKILTSHENHWEFSDATWGFPKYKDKGLIINARAETALEKNPFREALLKRRCIVPAKGFYEWDASKNKFCFTNEDESILFMAGIIERYETTSRFVILTKNANASMLRIHDRMPLILSQEQIKPWIFDQTKTNEILKSTPPLLTGFAQIEQLSLW